MSMTENPARKKNTGESGNGGQFGNQTRPEADSLLAPPVEHQKELDTPVLARFPEAEPALHSGVVANPSHPLQHQEVSKMPYTSAIEGTPTIGAGRIGPELVWNNGARRKFRSHQITEARKELNRIAHLPELGAKASAEQRRNRKDRAYEAQTQLGLAVREFVRGHGGDVGVIGLAT